MSRRDRWRRRMLQGMPLWKLRREDEERLRQLAVRDHRSLREQGEFYLHLMIQQEYAKFLQDNPEIEVAEVA